MAEHGKFLIAAGIVLVLAGIVLTYGGKIPFPGKLPGDILIKKQNFTFYFPLATSLLLSLIISLVLYFLKK